MANQCPVCGNQMPEKRIYTESEIKKMSRETYEACRDDVLKAAAEGRIQKGV